MADFAAVLFSLVAAGVRGAQVATSLGDTSGAPNARLCSAPSTGAEAQHGPVHENAYALPAIFQESVGQELWEKVLVSPRKRGLGFVLAENSFSIAVYSTHRARLATMTALQIEGQGGTVVGNPYSLPLALAPLQGLAFGATVPRDGVPTVDDLVRFVFTSDTGTDCEVTGTRLTIFTADADRSTPVSDTTEHFTNVLVGYDSTEQRIRLRRKARQRLGFHVLTSGRRESAQLQALLWGWQHRMFGVPYWPDTLELRQDVQDGALQLAVDDTTSRHFTQGGLVMLWRDMFTAEALTIAGVTPTGVSLTAPVSGTWPADGKTKVVPLFAGRLPDDLALQILTGHHVETDVEFTSDPTAAPFVYTPQSTAHPEQYLGYDVLMLEHNGAADREHRYTRSLYRLDGQTGAVSVLDRAGVSIFKATNYTLLLESRAQVDTFMQWRDARAGQLVPCWVPTWKQDLELAADVSAGQVHLPIVRCGYSQLMYQDVARRHVLIMDGAGNHYFRKIVGTADASPEILELDQALPGDLRADSCAISFLTLCRLAADDVKLDWITDSVAEASLELQELAKETPA